MTWVKIDDGFADHPKVVAAGALASWLFVCGLTYCSRQLTDGFIPSGQVRKLADVDDAVALAQVLITVGLWEKVEGGYRVVPSHQFIRFGADPTTQELRHSAEYKQWRRSVLQRDGWRCRYCQSDGDLHAHHIKPWATFPDDRFLVNNGLTLCAPCHKAVHHGECA